MVWVCGWIISTLHLISLGVDESNALGTGFILSWFYWAFLFDDKRIAFMYIFILMTIFASIWTQ